jgi:hypothetical protein
MYDSVPGYEKNVHSHDRFLYDFLSEKCNSFLSSKNHSMIKPILIKSKKPQTKDHTHNV